MGHEVAPLPEAADGDDVLIVEEGYDTSSAGRRLWSKMTCAHGT